MQARKIVLLGDVIEDLREIKRETYRVSHSRKVADDYIKRIRMGMRHLAYTAEVCPYFQRGDGSLTGYRLCVIQNHIAYFKVDAAEVRIMCVLYKRASFDARMRRSEDD